MKNKSVKQIERNWWWKQREILRNVKKSVDWPAVEEAARNYELMRRSPKGKHFTHAYWELSRGEKTVVHTLWTNGSQAACREAIRREQYNEKGWTPFYENEHRQWNLRLADNLLIKEFIKEIRILREIQKIRPQHPLKGKKFRGVSWQLIELLDLKQNGTGKFSDSQRHTLTDARRRAKKSFVEYKRAVTEHKKRPLDTLELLEKSES